MTVSYTGEVPNGSAFGCFWKVLKIWRGSVYKLVWREALAFVCIYYMINIMYRFGLPEPQKRVFEKVRNYTSAYVDYMPSILSFLLGFYVNLVVSRWWTQYKLLPWPDNLAMIISYAIPNSNGETGRLMRRNIMRYMVLAYVITLQRISLRVKRRFPTPQHLVDAGLMMESERKIFDTMNAKSPMSKYWMPLVWGTNIINRARKDGVITSDQIVQSILSELKDIRTRLGGLIGFDTVCVPLVYTQVASIACYTFFIALLIGRQMIPAGEHTTKTRDDEKFPDLFFPLFTFLQFIFYLGWLKVAEVLINPFGEDDDDIELNWLIDRHIKTSYMIVDEMHEEYPELLKDQYWEEVVPKDLPYTVASEHYRKHEPKGSAENYKIKQSDSMYANIIPTKRIREDDTYADYESVDTPMAERRKSSNWISRQVSRMGSVRSQSTAYSSGGLFSRNRLNSVYSSPESGLPPGISHPPQGKPSLYDKFVNRKSLRNHRQLLKQNSKLTLNGINQPSAPKTSRPRIPTPDVSKEGYDKESKINLNFAAATHLNGNTPSSTASGVAVVAQNLSKQPLVYPTDDKFTSCHLLLSPIKESDCSSSNNTLQPGHPATAALAQACLPKNFQAAIPTTTTIPVTSIAFPTSTGTVSIVPLHSGGIPEITTTPPTHDAIPSIALSVTIPRDTSSDSIKELLQGDTIDGIINFQDNQGNSISRSGSFSLGHAKILTQAFEATNTTSTPLQTLTAGSATLTTSSSALQLQQPELILSPHFDQTISTSAPSTLTKREVQEAKHSEVYV